ncbi:MAG: glycosyltransferase [Phycisphaerae bacterium]|nr:glycosyltransferase [Phycisphaerae bacterium]
MRDSTAPVSLIVPCRNGQRTLGEALETVFAQTVPPFEVLLIDDGSQDRSVAIARSFGPQVRVLRNPSRGPGAARRLGVSQARGQFIAFVDADDWLDPTKHERQLRVLESSDTYTLVHTDSLIVQEDGSSPPRRTDVGRLAVGRCTQVIFERNPVCGASTMLRRCVALELGNYDAEVFGTEDYAMSLVASTRCTFVHLPEPLYRVRRHAHNLTNRRAHMAYHHWLAQEKFRQRCPESFAQLPAETISQYMIEPVLRTVTEAYWRRESTGYRQLLRLAVSLSPDDPRVRMLWQRRRRPLWSLRLWDRVQAMWTQPAQETHLRQSV